MRKRLTQPFLGWQLAIAAVIAFPAIAVAQTLDSVTRVQALERVDFPRAVFLVGDLPPSIDEAAWNSAVSGALASWNEVPCSYAELTYGGRVDTATQVPDDATAVAFVDGGAESCFVIDNNIGWTLTVGCGDWGATAVLLNINGYRWSASPAPYQATTDQIVDVRSVLTHELGHVLGLHHPDVTDPLATMGTRYLRDGGLATLAAQDKRVLCDTYPQDAWECEIPDQVAACGEGRCVTDGSGAVGICEEPRVPTGGYCDLADLNCGSSDASVGPPGARCFVTSPATYSGYCTQGCDSAGDCPDDMVCGDEAECRYAATPFDRTDGCSSADSGANPSCSVLLLSGFILLRRRRASSRTPADLRRGVRRRTSQRRATPPGR